MDKDLLVSSGHALLELIAKDGMKLRAALWVHNPDTDSWRLWIVPEKSLSDKREFYRRLSTIIAKNQQALPGIEAADTEFVLDSHPAIAALKGLVRVNTGGTIKMSNTMLNSFYLPDAIILLMDF